MHHKNQNKNTSERYKSRQQDKHIPVLLKATLKYLDPKLGDSYLDLTAGYGGHADKVLERTEAPETAVLIDRDKDAVSYLQEKYKGWPVKIVHSDFLAASRELFLSGRRFDNILADIGVSSLHLNTASRGFSIKNDGPLDMRMDQSQSLSADTIVNSYSEKEIETMIRVYGEEPRAKIIARAILAKRPVKTTGQLAQLVASVMPKGGKIHPATKTFQALRIAVNSEIEQLKASMPIWIDLLNEGGRLAIICFHSLEDRIVKLALAAVSGNRYDATLQLLTRHPVVADPSEIVSNPRARSAKLRAAVKIKIQKERGD